MKENHQRADWLAQKYTEEKFSVPQIASMSGVSKSTIRYWMRKHDLPSRKRGYRNLQVWSDLHGLEACKECHSDERPHHSLGLCKTCYHRLWGQSKGKDYRKEVNRKSRDKLRREVLSAYSEDPPLCACCGEEHIEFLQLDHINGDGRQHRAGFKGSEFYVGLRKQGFPKDLGLRVLCSNCNFAHGHYGYCPHTVDL